MLWILTLGAPALSIRETTSALHFHICNESMTDRGVVDQEPDVDGRFLPRTASPIVGGDERPPGEASEVEHCQRFGYLPGHTIMPVPSDCIMMNTAPRVLSSLLSMRMNGCPMAYWPPIVGLPPRFRHCAPHYRSWPMVLHRESSSGRPR